MRGLRYIFSRQFLEHIGLRLSGPANFRFIVQPLFAIILGIRDGINDATAGRPPYIYDIILHPDNRARNMREGWKSLWLPIIVSTVLDAVVQYLILRTVYVIAAVIVGVLLMGIPYALTRGFSNRVYTGYHHVRSGRGASQGNGEGEN